MKTTEKGPPAQGSGSAAALPRTWVSVTTPHARVAVGGRVPQHTTLHRMWHLFVEASVEYSFLFDVEKTPTKA